MIQFHLQISILSTDSGFWFLIPFHTESVPCETCERLNDFYSSLIDIVAVKGNKGKVVCRGEDVRYWLPVDNHTVPIEAQDVTSSF